MKLRPQAVLGAAAIAGVLAFGTSAHAYLTGMTVNKCLSGKVKTSGKGAAAYAGCHAKGAQKSIATDPGCLSKVQGKNVAAFGKLDAKGNCLTTGDGASRDADSDNYADSLDAAVGHAGKCDAGKTKTVGKYIAAVMGCYAKAAGKGGVVSTGPGKTCTQKSLDKVNAAIGKLELKGGCSTNGNAAALVGAADAFMEAQVCALDPSNPGCVVSPTPTPTSTPGAGNCGNGAVDPGEDCDLSAGAAGTCENASNTGATFACVSCQCACPTSVTFSGDATAPESVLDTGWTGISHRAPIVSNGDVSIAVSGCAGSSRPCGVCNVTGPIANPNAGAGQIDNQRCSTNSAKACTTDAECSARTCAGGVNDGDPCTNDGECPGAVCPAAGTCEFYFGTALPLAAGGVTTCVFNQFDGPVSGTANIETGDAVTSANLRATVYNGLAIDNPCPRCVGDGVINDGTTGGTCDGGLRVGLACDANGAVPGRPDFGATSLDCPLAPGAVIATLPIDLSNATAPVTATLDDTLSPTCQGSNLEKCLCDTCNNANQEPCFTNADCPMSGGNPGICGGRRCLGGANNGAPCNNASICPGGACNRPGAAAQPSACLDDTSTVNTLDCVDGDADGEGECTQGPVDNNCSLASGHAQRGCLADVDCGGGLGSCESNNRLCFLTGGGTGPSAKTGTGTLVAEGQADTPVNDSANPTLGSVFCVGPTGSSSVNSVAGLPGPSRVTIKGTAVGAP